jgi:demethylmacrocin O-methyltransferase
MSQRALIRLLLLLVPVMTLAGCSASPLPSPPPAAPPPAAPQLGVLSAAAGSTDKGPSQHNYTELYERLLFQWKNDAIKIFEIGIAEGGSLAMWQTYFPNARIFAVDILEKAKFDNRQVTTLVADQASREQLQKAIDASGSDIHVLIDDGGHTMEQQQVSLGFLFRHVRPGGYYIIEDVHTSLPELWEGYGVAGDGRNTTLRMLENFVRSSSPAIRSEYMLESEMAYLTEHIESVTISHRPQSRSIVCVLKKKA